MADAEFRSLERDAKAAPNDLGLQVRFSTALGRMGRHRYYFVWIHKFWHCITRQPHPSAVRIKYQGSQTARWDPNTPPESINTWATRIRALEELDALIQSARQVILKAHPALGNSDRRAFKMMNQRLNGVIVDTLTGAEILWSGISRPRPVVIEETDESVWLPTKPASKYSEEELLQTPMAQEVLGALGEDEEGREAAIEAALEAIKELWVQKQKIDKADERELARALAQYRPEPEDSE